jgi:hypothetical protein
LCFIGHYENIPSGLRITLRIPPIMYRSRHAFSLSAFCVCGSRLVFLVYYTIAHMSSFLGQCERLSRCLVYFKLLKTGECSHQDVYIRYNTTAHVLNSKFCSLGLSTKISFQLYLPHSVNPLATMGSSSPSTVCAYMNL